MFEVTNFNIRSSRYDYDLFCNALFRRVVELSLDEAIEVYDCEHDTILVPAELTLFFIPHGNDLVIIIKNKKNSEHILSILIEDVESLLE